MAAMGSETGSWEQIRGRGEDLLDERFLQRLLRAERPPLWILLEAAEHFFHAGELQRAREFLTKAAESPYADPLLDELQAKIAWVTGDREGGLRLAQEGAAKWEMALFHHLTEAMMADDQVEIMEPVWRTQVYHLDAQDECLLALRLRLSGAGLRPQIIAEAVGSEADFTAPGVWALESLGAGETEDSVLSLLERMTRWPANTSLKSIPGVTLAVLEILAISRRDQGIKHVIEISLKPPLLQRLGELEIAVEMLG